MKTIIFVVALLALFIGCTSQREDQLTAQQRDQVKSEVKATLDSMMVKFENLDASGFIQYYWDSPDFISYAPDGSRSDFPAFKKSVTEFCNSGATVKPTLVRAEFTVLTNELVITAWVGKSVVSFKSGDKAIYNPDAVTWVFKNFAGHWKIIYSHESATITMQTAGKK